MKRILHNLTTIVSETWTIAWEEAGDSEAVPAPLVVHMPKYPVAPEKTEAITVDKQAL